ncbi:MAG TPA: hypothetical protein VHX40_07935 [Acidimicrobiales bacterium]|nr:hypothetical protein [Acidimicrobiales bacterium]
MNAGRGQVCAPAPGRSGGRRVWRTGAVALAVLASVALTACTSVRDDLGTSDSGCYVALPVATAAVGHHGHLRGVRLVDVSALRGHASRLYRAATSAPGPKIGHVCLVAYTGHFDADTVTQPIGQPQGVLAVVEVEYPDNRLVATLLIAHPPLSFGHSHLGLF